MDYRMSPAYFNALFWIRPDFSDSPLDNHDIYNSTQRRVEPIPVPCFGHLSDRFAKRSATVKPRCDRSAQRFADGEAVTIIIDSSGLRFGCANQWYETKYGEKANQTPWRKMHLAMDADMNIHQIDITDT